MGEADGGVSAWLHAMEGSHRKEAQAHFESRKEVFMTIIIFYAF